MVNFLYNATRIPGNLGEKSWKNHGKVMEFCQAEKVGTLPQKMKSWPELGTLSFDYPRIPPLPPMKSWPELGTLSFGYPRIPPSPQKMKSWPEPGTLSFDYPRIPPPP